MAKQSLQHYDSEPKNRRKQIIIALISLLALLFLLTLVKTPGANFTFTKFLDRPGQSVFAPMLTPEVQLCEDLNIENWYAYHRCANVLCTIYAQSTPEQHHEVRKRVRNNRGQVEDAIRTVIGNAELHDLRDPELGFIKRQLQSHMDQIIGEGMVQEILIPQWHAGRGRDSRRPATARAPWNNEY